MKLRWLSILVFLFLSSSLTADTYRVIVVEKDGSPVSGASVHVFVDDERAAQTQTASDGSTTFKASPGAEVVVELDGFAPSRRLAVIDGETARVVLEPAEYAEEMTVVAAQSRVPLAEVPSSVTIVEREELADVLQTSANLADALAKSVPGLAPGSGSASIYGQTIRGRGMQILVDGVPLTTLRNTSRDLVSFDPSTIERVEVLRGTTALYGDGATGGLINIVTRPAAGSGLALSTDLQAHSSLTHAGDSAGGKIVQSISGGGDAIDFRIDLGAERTGASFDAAGDRRPPDPYGQGGLADIDSWMFLGKVGVNLARDQRLLLTLNRFESEQSTTWTTDPSVNAAPARSVKSRAIEGLELDHPQGSDNLLLQLAYEMNDMLGSTFRAMVYGRQYETVFTPFDGRPFAVYGHQIFQSRLESEARGARLDLQTPLPVPGLTLYWGADAGSEETAQPVWIIDPTMFDQSGGRSIRTIDDRPWVPLIDKRNQAAFAQLEWAASSHWLLRGGVRHERVQADIPTFSTLAGASIDGGRREWSDTLINAGIVYYLTGDSRLFASFAEGFSLPDIGLILRSAPAGASLDTLPFQPQIVRGWEAGWQDRHGRLNWSLSAFYSTSELGTSTAGFNQPVVRAPERVYGTEAQIEFRSTGLWSAGAIASWTEGRHDPNRDGSYTWLNNYRIPAPNGTAWIEHRTSDTWRNRLQVLWSGDRDRFGASAAFGERSIDSYTVLDLLSTLDLSLGRLSIGVQNALNAEYFVRDAQLMRSGRNDSHTAAPGATLTMGWSLRY